MNGTVIIILVVLVVILAYGITIGYVANKNMVFRSPLGKNPEAYLAKMEKTYPGITEWVRANVCDMQEAGAQAKDANASEPLTTFRKIDMTNKDNHKVTAYHTVPESEGGYSEGVVLLLHGHNGCALQMMPYAQMYMEMGYSILIPNWEHHGDSEGDATQMGFQEKEDCAMWIGKAMELYPEASKKHLVLHGVSMGGATAMLNCLNKNVTEVIDDCGYSTLHSEIVSQFYRKHMPGVLGAFGFGLVNAVRLVWVPAMVKPIKEVSQSTIPMLFIHGTEDKTVPYWMARSLHACKIQGRKELWTVEGGEHAKTIAAHPEEYRRRVSEFLR